MKEARAYYNENDKKAAATLRELIKENLIAPGDVDERSIEDVTPNEVRNYTQCHFFAGYGIWSLAFRLAGWADHRPVWTGSCPCQPFSAAGKGAGFADERHLWPAFFHLIQHGKRSGVRVYGEQVASPAGIAWLDLVWTDMEAIRHTFRPFVLASAGYGAPIIRQRTYWMASSAGDGRVGQWAQRGFAAQDRSQPRSAGTGLVSPGPEGRRAAGRLASAAGKGRGARLRDSAASSLGRHLLADRGGALGLDGPTGQGLEGHAGDGNGEAGRQESSRYVASAGDVGRMGGPESGRRGERGHEALARRGGHADSAERTSGRLDSSSSIGRQTSWDGDHIRDEWLVTSSARQDGEVAFADSGAAAHPDPGPGPTNGFWRAADWLRCRDELWRPVEPGTFPLAHGYPERVGILRGAGNAISPWVAKEFIEASEGLSHY